MSYKYIYKCFRFSNGSFHFNSSRHLLNDKIFRKTRLNNNFHLFNCYKRQIYTTSAVFNKDLIDSESNINKSINKDIIVTTDIKKLKESLIINNSAKSPKDSNDIKATPPDLSASVPKKEDAVVAKKLPLWQRIKNELIHYYHGFKLLFLELKVTLGILNTLTKGKTLTRRERKQLVRTSADLARMVPFLVFIIVPFMEFLLPFYIKFFPFMMPSTFHQDNKETEKIRQLLKGKLEIAKFLQETLTESKVAKKPSLDGKVSMETFSQFLKQVRDSGLTANTEDILRYSQLFEDEVTLESLAHSQLKALCKMLELNVMGPPALLRFQLRMKVRHLKVDDQLIASEGIEKVPVWELQQLCRERGMRSIGVSEERLRYQFSQWLSLHLDNKVPITLLLLTRIIYLPDTLTTEEKLKQAILVLPQSVSNEAKLKAVTTEERIDNKTKFEVIKEEQKVIKQERVEALKAAKVAVSELPPAEPIQSSEDKAPIIKTSQAAPDIASKIEIPKDIIDSTRIKLEIKTGDEPKDTAPRVKPAISIEDLSQIGSAIVNLKETKEIFAKEELEDLKESREQLAVNNVPDTAAASTQPDKSNKTVAKRLGDKVDKMINEMDTMFDELHKEKGDKTLETSSTPPTKQDLIKERFISVEDLKATLMKMDLFPDEEKWKQILHLLDEDGDGMIEMDHVTKMIKLLGSEQVQLTEPEVTKLLDMLDKEAIVAESKKTQ